MNPANASLDFGYPWWLSYGHLTVLGPAVTLLIWGYARKWHKAPMIALSILALWSGAAFGLMRYALNTNTVPSLPTQAFLQSGSGRVLDLGAGTGRSSIMVLKARPKSTVVALDQFGGSFEMHFGKSQSPQQKLLNDLNAAGVEERTSIETSDMRKLRFSPASFDAGLSAYAIDHLDRKGIEETLAEAERVIKPGGDLLLILIANDRWGKFAFGPLLAHGGTHGREWWTERLEESGFQVVEQGTQPITLYLLARRM